MKKVLMSLLLVCFTLCLLVGCCDEHDEPKSIDESLYTMKKGTEWFSSFQGTTDEKSKITDIIFTNEIPSGKTEQEGIDLTENKTGKVKGYIIPNGDDFKIYIVGDYIFGNEDCTEMFRMFFRLTSLDLSNFNTSNVTNMKGMFQSCSGLISLNLSSFNTSNVTDMSNMFNGCSGLSTLDVSKFNTSKVTNMKTMFSGCSKLETLDLSSFNTSNVTDMSDMFSGCSELKTLDLSKFDTSKVTSIDYMFYGNVNLNSVKIDNDINDKIKDNLYNINRNEWTYDGTSKTYTKR